MVKLKIDQVDIKRNVSLRELLKAQSGDMGAIVDILGRFVIDEDGQKMTPEQGREVVLDMTIEQIEQATKALYGGVMDAAVPPMSAAS